MFATATVSPVGDENRNKQIILLELCLLSFLRQRPVPSKPEAKAKKPAKVRNLPQLRRGLMAHGCNSTAYFPFPQCRKKRL